MADSTITKIARGAFSAQVDAQGAQLMSLNLDGREYLWQRDARWWAKSAPILFPIVGSLRNGEASTAEGPAHMGRHGLARNYRHEIVSETDEAVSYRLVSTSETREQFPFDFMLEMTYRIVDDASLEQVYKVTNTGSVPLPFTEGGHPAFNVPLPGTDECFEDYEVRFTEPWTPVCPLVTPSGLMDYGQARTPFENDDHMPLSRDAFTQDAWVFQNVPDSTIELVGTKSGHGIRCDFEGFTSLGVWSFGDAPFAALEPWLGHATATDEDDVFEHKRDTVLLDPGAVDERSFTLTVF